MDTDILYMDSIDNCYIKDFEAEVTAVEEKNDRTFVILNRTAFYPVGGGQPTDKGKIIWKNGFADIVEVKKKNRFLHFLKDNSDVPPLGEMVMGEIDWERRYAHMRMHTAQHLVSSLVWDRYGASTVGNQIHKDYSHIDFKPADLSMEELKDLEYDLNNIIEKSGKIRLVSLDRKTLEEKVSSERVDLSRLPSSVKMLRTVLIDDGRIDICPCAGTHVKALKELGGIVFIKRKSKGKGTLRVQYELSEP